MITLLSLLVIFFAKTTAEQATIPVCSRLSVRATSNGRIFTPGSKVHLIVNVNVWDDFPLRNMVLGINSSVVTDWKPLSKTITPASIRGTETYYLDEASRNQNRRYKLVGRVCAGVENGLKNMAEVTMYQLNDSSEIPACMSRAASIQVSPTVIW